MTSDSKKNSTPRRRSGPPAAPATPDRAARGRRTGRPGIGAATGTARVVARVARVGAAVVVAVCAASANSVHAQVQDEDAAQTAAGLVDAALTAARDAASASGLADAREQLLKVARRYPRSEHVAFPARSRALVEAASLAGRIGEDSEAGSELLEVLEREAQNEWTPRAHLELGRLLLRQGDWETAAMHLQQAREGAVSAGTPGAVADDALDLLTLVHRMVLRPLAGQESWLAARSFLPAQAGIEKPRGVAAGMGGELVVLETNRAAVLGANGSPLVARDLRGLVRPVHAAAGVPGLLTADGATGVEDTATVTFTRPAGGALDRLLAAHRDAFGAWTVLSRRSAEVLRLDRNGRPTHRLSMANMVQPIDLAVSRDGAIHVLDAGNRSTPASVLRFAPDGSLDESFRADWRRPAALDVDWFGNRYVLDEGTLQVEVYDPTARLLARLGPVLPGGVELRAPGDVAVDGQGRIFIADSRLGQVLVLE